jgi:hypothetical protein
MERKDFVRLIGTEAADGDYAPIAFLLKSSYAGLGYYNASVNEGFTEVCVLLNARLLNLNQAFGHDSPPIRSFTELIEEIALSEVRSEEKSKPRAPEFGDPVPIVAVPLSEFAVIYPVSQIRTLLARAKKERGSGIPTFFDFSKSEILSLLRMRLW